MSDERITSLPVLSDLDGSEWLAVDDGSTTYRLPSDTYQQRFVEDVAADHGADPSGASDDTQAFADAIATGRTLWVPDGSYNVDANTITPSSGQSILMAPGATINQRTDETGGPHALIDLTDVDDVDVLGGTLVGRKGTEGTEVTHGVRVAGGSNITLGTHCEQFTRDGAYVNEGTSISVNVTVKTAMRCTNNGRNGLAVVACDGLDVEGGVYDSNDGPAGLDIEPAGTSNVDAVRVGRVVCHSNAAAGFQYYGKSGSEGLTVNGAISRDNTGYGFRVARISHARFGVCDSYRNGDSGWRVDRHVDYATEHNTFVACGSWNNGGHGFDVPDAHDGDLIGCTAMGNTLDGVLLSGVNDWTITGGKYSGNRNGMNLSSATGATITGADVRDNGDHGIRGRNIVDCGFHGVTVENNDQNAGGANGIEVTHSTESRDNRITGCRIRSGGSQDNGIRLSSNSNDNMVADNDLEGAGTAANLSDAGTGNDKRGNKGYVTENEGTATFSGDGATTTFSVPHGLAEAPTGRAVWAESADAAADRYVSAVDATNIDVTFTTAPASGTDNVVLGFQARA